MRKIILFAPSLLGLLITLTACSTLNAKPSLTGSWQLQQVAPVNTAPLSPGETSFSLELLDENRAGGTVACNRWRGHYVLEPDRIDFDRLSRTRRFCTLPPGPAAELESRYLTRLEQGPRYRLDGEQLVLEFADGETWRFGR